MADAFHTLNDFNIIITLVISKTLSYGKLYSRDLIPQRFHGLDISNMVFKKLMQLVSMSKINEQKEGMKNIVTIIIIIKAITQQ